MSLTAFNRLRRMKQEEAMKPENIEQPKEEKVEAPVEEVEEETKTSARRGRRA